MSNAHKTAAKGLSAASTNLNREIASIKKSSFAGVLALGQLILARSNKRVPREYGNLVGSGYARKGQNNPQSVEIGYSASYAVYVHENLEMKLKGQPRPSGLGKYWGPSGEAKFLQKSIDETRKDVPRVLGQYAKKGR